METLKQSLVKISLFTNSSQTIRPKGLQFLQFDGGHRRDIITKFSEVQFVLKLLSDN